MEQFYALRACPGTYYNIVVVDKQSDQIVGVGGVFVERKFLRGLASCGHIEDIAVDKQQQGKKIGLRIIQALTGISETAGCYKTILNCSDHNIRAFCSFLFIYLADDVDAVRIFQRFTRNADSRRRRTRWPSTPTSVVAHLHRPARTTSCNLYFASLSASTGQYFFASGIHTYFKKF
jgi:GNAT superfamily N-acetyltransferase